VCQPAGVRSKRRFTGFWQLGELLWQLNDKLFAKQRCYNESIIQRPAVPVPVSQVFALLISASHLLYWHLDKKGSGMLWFRHDFTCRIVCCRDNRDIFREIGQSFRSVNKINLRCLYRSVVRNSERAFR